MAFGCTFKSSATQAILVMKKAIWKSDEDGQHFEAIVPINNHSLTLFASWPWFDLSKCTYYATHIITI